MCHCTPMTLGYLSDESDLERYPYCDYEKCEIPNKSVLFLTNKFILIHPSHLQFELHGPTLCGPLSSPLCPNPLQHYARIEGPRIESTCVLQCWGICQFTFMFF